MKPFTILVLALFLQAPTLRSQTAGERTSVDLTIYNANLALVRETRTMTLAEGLNTITIPDIPATIDGTSLHFTSQTDPRAVRVLEQNFQYDLVHHAKLLEKYVGKQIQFVRVDPSTDKEYTVTGRLVASGWQPQFSPTGYGQQASASYAYSGQMIAEIDGKLEISPAGRLILPSLPDGLILKPQLQWLVTSSRRGSHQTEISYLASQLSWNCTYVVVLNESDTKLDLTGWVTLTNHSGTTFQDAGLKLVAGDVNLVRPDAALDFARKAMVAEAAAPQFQQRELFEYKLYSLQRKTTLANNETKQIELATGNAVPSRKQFVYNGLEDSWRIWRYNTGYRDQGSFGRQSQTKVGVFISFRNNKESGLGIPLPKGTVRVYKKDVDGKEQFIGEDEIDHTPKDEEVRLFLGNAFDLVGSRVQKDFRVVVSGHVIEERIEIKVKNHKDEEVEVLVAEHPWRWNQWEITKANAKWVKVDQSTIHFPVSVKPNSETTIDYVIRYSW